MKHVIVSFGILALGICMGFALRERLFETNNKSVADTNTPVPSATNALAPGEHYRPVRVPVERRTNAMTVKELPLTDSTHVGQSLSALFESGRYEEVTRRLRTLGFSDPMIAAILESDIELQFMNRSNDLMRAYWKNHSSELSELEEEKKRQLEIALEASGLSGSANSIDGQVNALEEKYQDYATNRYAGNVKLGPANIEAYLGELEMRKIDELAEILSDDELREYKYRNSRLSRKIVEQVGIDLNEQEFRAVFDVNEAQGQLWADYQNGIISFQQYSEARGQLFRELERQLGERRFREYENSLSPGYAVVSEVFQNRGLPPTKLEEFYSVVSDSRSGAIVDQFGDPDVAASEVRRRLVGIVGEAVLDDLVARGADVEVFGFSLSSK